MKKLKYVILVLITAVTAMFSMLTQSYIENSMHEVEVFSVKPVSMENVVVCSGTIEYSKKLTIDYDENISINKCHIKAGDRVKEGDVLFSATQTAVVPETVSKDILEEEMYAALASGDLSVLENLGKAQVSATAPHAEEKNGEKVKIYSPYTGVITSLKYDEGDTVSKGSTIAVVSPSDALQVVLSISESQISDIKIGQAVTITGAGFKNSKYSGIVESIAPYAEQTASAFGKATTVEVTVAITDPDDDIKSGFTAKCSITVSQEDCIALPYEYIGCDDNGSEYVLVYDSGFARKKYISTGNEYMECIQVLSGVSMSDRIITKPAAIDQDDRIVLKKGSVER